MGVPAFKMDKEWSAWYPFAFYLVEFMLPLFEVCSFFALIVR